MNPFARFAAAAALAVVSMATGCKGQGIGERCTFGINSDCEDGLLCFQGTPYSACCPANGPTCAPNVQIVPDAALDSSTDATDGSDAVVDAGEEPTVDAASDATDADAAQP